MRLFITLFVFFGIMLPTYFIINKYIVAFVPIAVMSIILYLYKEEILQADWNILKDRSLGRWTFKALQYGIIAQALCNVITASLISSAPVSIAGDLIARYPVMPLYSVLIGPVVEEIVFRKTIFAALAKRYSFWFGAAVSSILFAAIHYSSIAAAGFFITGLIFCYIYEKSGSILPTILAHSAINFVVLVVSTVRG